MLRDQLIGVVIPALNEERSIRSVLASLPSIVDRVIVVDNGSVDQTASVATAHGAVVVREARRGYGSACLAGIAAIGDQVDILVFLDADFSDHPEQLEKLVEPIVAGDADLIIGSRTLDFMIGNHLPGGADMSAYATGSFSETVYQGVGFGLGFANKLNAFDNGSPASVGSYFWGGLASTLFWVDPTEELVVIFMTQLMPSSIFNFRGQLESLVYAALE